MKNMVKIIAVPVIFVLVGGVVWFIKIYNKSAVDSPITATSTYKADWKTYVNKDYGFSFKHPSEWIVINYISFPERAQLVIGPDEKHFYNLLIQNYKNAPTSTPRLAGDEPLKSQRELDGIREKIMNNPTVKNYNNIFILEDNAVYSPFDSGFLNVANFFINKDYVYLTSYLPIEDNDCSTVQNPNAKCYMLDEKNYVRRNMANIEAKAEEINKGIVSVEVKESIELFNKVLSTIEIL
ncbi:MAG: hypothetical protein HYT15_00120 [Candidatus Magasanikbacteria bacterium]|nr:hypothetical protein [Candidatus Magasanikbacteria bacterium]